jgi:hypothetical protein
MRLNMGKREGQEAGAAAVACLPALKAFVPFSGASFLVDSTTFFVIHIFY